MAIKNQLSTPRSPNGPSSNLYLHVEGKVADVDLAGGAVHGGGHPHHQSVGVHEAVGLVLWLYRKYSNLRLQ